MESISEIVGFMVKHRFMMMIPMFLIFFVLLFGAKKGNRLMGFLAYLVMGSCLLNIISGPSWNAKWLYKNGTTAEAVVYEVKRTNSTYNDEPVLRYKTYIKEADGSTVETSFTSMSFNIYPKPGRGYHYPVTGQPFMVKYIPGVPQNFIILSDAPSAYTQQNECKQMVQKVFQAKIKYDLDNSKVEPYRSAILYYLDSDCVQEGLKLAYSMELERIK